MALNPQSPIRFNIYRDMAIAKQSMGDACKGMGEAILAQYNI